MYTETSSSTIYVSHVHRIHIASTLKTLSSIYTGTTDSTPVIDEE